MSWTVILKYPTIISLSWFTKAYTAIKQPPSQDLSLGSWTLAGLLVAVVSDRQTWLLNFMEWDFYWLARVLEKNERRFFKKNFSFLLYTLENVGRLLLYACNNWFMKMPSNSRGPNIRSIVMFNSYSRLVVLHQRRLQICNRFSKAVAHFLSSSRANIETAAKPKGVMSSLMHMIIINFE